MSLVVNGDKNRWGTKVKPMSLWTPQSQQKWRKNHQPPPAPPLTSVCSIFANFEEFKGSRVSLLFLANSHLHLPPNSPSYPPSISKAYYRFTYASTFYNINLFVLIRLTLIQLKQQSKWKVHLLSVRRQVSTLRPTSAIIGSSICNKPSIGIPSSIYCYQGNANCKIINTDLPSRLTPSSSA